MSTEELGYFMVLTSVEGDLLLSGNDFTTLDGLDNLVQVQGSINISDNRYLTDINGLKQLQGNESKLLTIDQNQYIEKVEENTTFCSKTWDLHDADNDIQNDMNEVCNNQVPYVMTDLEHFKLTLNNKCNISTAVFNQNFDATTGTYDGFISCAGSELNDEDLSSFKVLSIISGSLYLQNNVLTQLEGLKNLSEVGGNINIANNPNLIDISGIENIAGDSRKLLYIDTLMCQPHIILINQISKQLFHFVTPFYFHTLQVIDYCLYYASFLDYKKPQYIQKYSELRSLGVR